MRKIQNEASEIYQTFGSSQAIVNCVMDVFGFEGGKVQLGFDYEIQKLTNKQETPSEVAFRLEYERKKALENYEKIMREKGFDGVIDGDFDDLRGVL